jgi:isoleucyl-tRNA synthetase
MSYPRPSTNPAAFGPAADVSPSPRFPEIERDVLDFWARDDTFRASIAQRDGAEEWVFYDGPPFANGLPHYGHLLTGYAKDLFPRFQTMRGKKVDRVFGWDTHGLPAELEAMKQLGITEKSEIEQMGIASFNAKARESVLEYTQQWEDYVTRQARWVDFERGYKTLDTGYMESVLWAFKSCGTRASPTRAPRAAVLLARRDPFVEPRAAHGRRRLQDAAGPLGHRHVPARRREGGGLGLTGVRALAWTTTPWTLPTNLALAVGPDIEYVVVPGGPNGAADVRHPATTRRGGAPLPARFRPARRLREGPRIRERGRGGRSRRADHPRRELADVHYDRLFDYYADAEVWGTERLAHPRRRLRHDDRRHRHRAPGARFGEDDQRITEAAGIPLIMSLDDGGRFLPQVTDVAGELWMDANRPLIRLLRAEGACCAKRPTSTPTRTAGGAATL